MYDQITQMSSQVVSHSSVNFSKNGTQGDEMILCVWRDKKVPTPGFEPVTFRLPHHDLWELE